MLSTFLFPKLFINCTNDIVFNIYLDKFRDILSKNNKLEWKNYRYTKIPGTITTQWVVLNIIIIDIKRYMDTRHQEEKGDSDIISYIYIYPFIRHACTIKST